MMSQFRSTRQNSSIFETFADLNFCIVTMLLLVVMTLVVDAKGKVEISKLQEKEAELEAERLNIESLRDKVDQLDKTNQEMESRLTDAEAQARRTDFLGDGNSIDFSGATWLAASSVERNKIAEKVAELAALPRKAAFIRTQLDRLAGKYPELRMFPFIFFVIVDQSTGILLRY